MTAPNNPVMCILAELEAIERKRALKAYSFGYRTRLDKEMTCLRDFLNGLGSLPEA